MKAVMTKEREGYHNLSVQIPAVLWDALCTEAEGKEESATRTLTRILQKHYQVSRESLPKPKRAGRPPKKQP